VSSPAVPWQRFLTLEILQLHALRPSCHSRPCISLVYCQLNYGAISSQPRLQSSTELNSLSLSHVTTDGQSASLSWYKAPIRGLRPDFFSVRNTEYV
jgi:hypothetical protein